ncbi:GTP binding protein [Cardiosporidium cionae]|uniref:GTP binding protein n=1 Tax=Cardiosporidium cionae TaxID=476202 RepID=A0ABQ7JAH6_9APIC|nr:GTP binding protein [Cardiosporidium cionae]|eukprot:KAF8820969.1 GTP binding protein [Cardiosporidium cionae]
MGKDFVIGCVGKPSAGKSSFFNAVTDAANAKVGNYPFTTIEPNQGIAYYTTQCPCKRFNAQCKPRYGSCINGKRKIPVKLLDIAGLIPGASQGRGLGNKFLDDLRHADVLLHIVDVSGCTNEKGEITIGYDPSHDHEWLVEEIELWIFNNLWSRWPSIARRHNNTKSPLAATLLSQLSGYDTKESMIDDLLNALEFSDPVNLLLWDAEKIRHMGGDTAANALKISKKHADTYVLLCSALAECFLRKLKHQRYILYEEGQMNFVDAEQPQGKEHNLKPLDDKLKTRLRNIQNLVLYRHGSTGVQAGINLAVETAGLIPVYPVKNIHQLRSDGMHTEVFPECILVRPGTSVKTFARMLCHGIECNFLYAEGIDGRRVSEDEILSLENNILHFVTSRTEKV